MMSRHAIVNVNYPTTGDCPNLHDHKSVVTRKLPNSDAVDVETCGSDRLPSDAEVVVGKECCISAFVIDARTKTDAHGSVQRLVMIQPCSVSTTNDVHRHVFAWPDR